MEDTGGFLDGEDDITADFARLAAPVELMAGNWGGISHEGHGGHGGFDGLEDDDDSGPPSSVDSPRGDERVDDFQGATLANGT